MIIRINIEDYRALLKRELDDEKREHVRLLLIEHYRALLKHEVDDEKRERVRLRLAEAEDRSRQNASYSAL